MIGERKNVQTTPTRTHCKHSRPLPYYNPNKQDAPALEVYPAPSHHPTTPWFRRRRLGIVIALSSSASLCKNLEFVFEYLCHYWIYFFETQTSCLLSKEEFTPVGQASQLKMKSHSWALCLPHVSVNWYLSL